MKSRARESKGEFHVHSSVPVTRLLLWGMNNSEFRDILKPVQLDCCRTWTGQRNKTSRASSWLGEEKIEYVLKYLSEKSVPVARRTQVEYKARRDIVLKPVCRSTQPHDIFKASVVWFGKIQPSFQFSWPESIKSLEISTLGTRLFKRLSFTTRNWPDSILYKRENEDFLQDEQRHQDGADCGWGRSERHDRGRQDQTPGAGGLSERQAGPFAGRGTAPEQPDIGWLGDRRRVHTGPDRRATAPGPGNQETVGPDVHDRGRTGRADRKPEGQGERTQWHRCRGATTYVWQSVARRQHSLGQRVRDRRAVEHRPGCGSSGRDETKRQNDVGSYRLRGGATKRHHRHGQDENSRSGGYTASPTTLDIHRQGAGRNTHTVLLQHQERRHLLPAPAHENSAKAILLHPPVREDVESTSTVCWD